MAARAIPGTSHGYQSQKTKDSDEKICDITVGEVIFQIEHQQYKNSEQLVSLLIVVWTCLASQIDQFQDVRSVFQFIYRETGKAIFSKAFAEINQNYKRGLSRILVECSEVLDGEVPNVAKLCSSMVMCIYDPWSDSALCEVISNDTVDEDLAADFVSLEPVDLLLLRIESLINSGLENSAVRLCRFCLKSGGLARSIERQQQKENICMVENWKLPFIEWLLRILFRKRLINEFVAESAACNCHDGVMLINNVKKCNKPESKAFAETLINVFLVRDLLFQKNYCCTKELMILWCEVQVKTKKSIDEVQEASRQLLNGHASSSAHFYLFIDCLWEKYGPCLVPLYLEMFIRGLSSDLNFLEAAREADDKEAVIEIENNMAAVYLKISTLLCDISKEISLECMLSSFSLDPTQEKLDLIRRLSFQIAAEKNKRTLPNSCLKATSSGRCGKDQDLRTVLGSNLPKRKSGVVTCDRGVQVGESPYIYDNPHSSCTEGRGNCYTTPVENEANISHLMSSMISRVVALETQQSISHQDTNTEQVMDMVKDVINKCLACVVQETIGDNVLLNDAKLCNPEELIPQIANDSNGELCMEISSFTSEPSQDPPCLTPIYKDLEEASSTNNAGTLMNGEESNSISNSLVIQDMVNELIGVVVDAFEPSPNIKPTPSYKQSETDPPKGILVPMKNLTKNKNIAKKHNHCEMNLRGSKKNSLSVVENEVEIKQVLNICDDKISTENSYFLDVCDINLTNGVNNQPILANSTVFANGNLSDLDKVPANVVKSKKINDNRIKASSDTILDAHSINGFSPVLSSQMYDKAMISNTLQSMKNNHQQLEQDIVACNHNSREDLNAELKLCNGGVDGKYCKDPVPSDKVMLSNYTGCVMQKQTLATSHSSSNANCDSKQIPTVSHPIENIDGNSEQTLTVFHPTESAGESSGQTFAAFRATDNTSQNSGRTLTASHSVENANYDTRQIPISHLGENTSGDDQMNRLCLRKQCSKVDHLIPFHHVVLEAEIPGVSKKLLSDFVIVLESLRNPELKSTRRWAKLKDACKEYLQSVTSQRCKFLNSQLNESVDSEADSTSELTALGDKDFASFQSDSVHNDPYVDRTPVMRRFMNQENSPKFNAFLNLSDIQNLFMPLDKLLRANASSSHHDHLKHHRKHRNKDRDPKKQALRHLRHNSRHNHDIIKKKKKKRRKGRKEKSHSKKHHSTHNKNGRDMLTTKKKRRLKKKKESPLEFPNGDYCSDFSSTELMRLVNEHSNNFPQVTANPSPHVQTNVSSGESDLILNCLPSKKKSKQVNFKKIKAKKNSTLKSHEKHKHTKNKPQRKDKKKSPNIPKLNAVKDYSHIVRFSSVKQMQSVQIRQSSVAVDLSDVNNDTQNNLNLNDSRAHPEDLQSSSDPTLKSCSQEEMMNIRMLLANNKQTDGGNEDRFGKSYVISSNKQSCSVLKYVSSKMTSRLLSVAQATNQLVMPNRESNASLNDNTLIPPGQFKQCGNKTVLEAKKNMLPSSEHVSSKALVPISPSSAPVKVNSRNYRRYTSQSSPLITSVTIPMAQNMQSAGNKLVAGKFMIPLGGCLPSTSGVSTLPKIGEIVVTTGCGVGPSSKSNVFIVKGNTSPQLSVQSLLAASKNNSTLRIPMPQVMSAVKNVAYFNKAKPNLVKKVVKKYIPCMQKSVLNNEVGLKRKNTLLSVPPSVSLPPEPVLTSNVPPPCQPEESKSEVTETIVTNDTPVPFSLDEVIKSIVADLMSAVINYNFAKTDNVDSNVPAQFIAQDAQQEKDESPPTVNNITSCTNINSQTTLQSSETITESPTEQSPDKSVLNTAVLPTESCLKDSGHVEQMSESSSDSTPATTSIVNLKASITAVQFSVKSPEQKTTFFSDSSPPLSSSPSFETQTETSLITNTTFSSPKFITTAAKKSNQSLTIGKLQPLTIGVMSTVRPQGGVINSTSKVEGISQTDTPTRSLTSISDAVRFSLMDMDDATGSVENQVLQAFNAFPPETVGYGNQASASETGISALTTSSTANQIVSQSSETFQASIRTSQSESFAECQISASTATEWNASDPLVSPSATGKAHETDSASELKDDEPVKKKRKKKDKIERDPEALQRFWCEICNRGFFSAYNLRRHCRNVHKMDLPKGTSDVPFTTSNSQCLAQVGARVICTTVPEGETQAAAQQLNITNKTSEFLLQSPTHDPKTKEFALQTSPPAHPKPIPSVSQNHNQSSNFPLHSPPPSATVQTPASLPISPGKDFRLQPPTSVAMGQAQHSSFMPVANTIPKPVPKFQRLQSVNTTTPQAHGLSRIGTSHQSAAASQTVQPAGLMQPSGSIQKPSETQPSNLVQSLPCQVQQIQQSTQCALSQGKKQDQRVGMLQAAQHAAQEQALRQARHAAELQQVQRAMQQAKKSVAAAQLSKAEALQQSQPPIQPPSATLSHLQSPILNPQMQKLVQIRQAALCGTPEFALQLSNQTGSSDIHTSPIKSPLQYFQTQVPNTQHPAILHSAVRQTLASCTATRQNQANQSFPGQQIQNMSNAEFLSRIVPHSNPERSSCSQTFPAMSAADLCLVSSQMHMPLIRQTSETNEGLEDLEQFLLENMPWSGEQITSQGIVQHSLNRMGTDPVALPIPVKPGAVVMQQSKNLSATRSKQTISKPKPYKPPITSLAKNSCSNKSSSAKKKAPSKKATDVLGCSEGNKTGFVSAVGNANAKSMMHCAKVGNKTLIGCTPGVSSEAPHVSSNLNENDSHSSDSVQCIEITQSSQSLKSRANNVSTSFNPFPQRDSSIVTDVSGFYNVGMKRVDHPPHCSPGLSEPPRISSNLLINNLNSAPSISNTPHTILQLSSSASTRHPTVPKPSVNVHCNEHVLDLPISKTQGTKMNCSTKLPPPKPPIRKFPEPLPKPNESLNSIEKDQVNPVIPIFDPNPLQNDNVDAEKEFNNLQSKISDCEKHLKNSEFTDESKTSSEGHNVTTFDPPISESGNCVGMEEAKTVHETNAETQPSKEQSLNNQEQRSNSSPPEKMYSSCSSLNPMQNVDGSNVPLPVNRLNNFSDKAGEKVGKVSKGIHFLDEQNESNDFKGQKNKEANMAKLDHKETGMLKNPISEQIPALGTDSSVKETSLTQKTPLPFPYSHLELIETSTTCTQSDSVNVHPTFSYSTVDVRPSDNCLNVPHSPTKTCHDAFENNGLQTGTIAKKEAKCFDQENNDTTSESFSRKPLDHVSRKTMENSTADKKTCPFAKTHLTEQHTKSTTQLTVTEKNLYPNIFSPSKFLEAEVQKCEMGSTKNDIFLPPNNIPPKQSPPINGKDIAIEKETVKCHMGQGGIQNTSFKSGEMPIKDTESGSNGDAEHATTFDASPVKQSELDGQTALGRTRLRDTPKTSVKRSCPCCTDSSAPRKCLARPKMMSQAKANNSSKAKNLLVIKTKIANGAAAPVQTRSSHRLRSKTGT